MLACLDRRFLLVRDAVSSPSSSLGLVTEAELAAVEALMLRLCQPADVAGGIAAEHLGTGGKRLRARLALAAARALGVEHGSEGWAAACELVHNGTLVHDDLQDGDELRRGHPTVWVRHGAAQAINAGDLMLILPYVAIAELPAGEDVRWRLALAMSTRTAAVIRGQAEEQTLTSRDHVRFADYEASVTGKTSALFELPVLGAALLSGRQTAEAEDLARPFRDLGLLFQMQDDVLDLFGEKGRGVVGSDLYEGKVSCLVVEHARLHASDAPALFALLRTPRADTPAAEVERTIERFRTGGALAAVLARMDDLRRRIEGDAGLGVEPDLAAVARELVATVLAPIAHVRAPG